MNLKQKISLFGIVVFSFFFIMIIHHGSDNSIFAMAKIADNESFGEEASEKEKEEDHEEEVEQVRENVMEEYD